ETTGEEDDPGAVDAQTPQPGSGAVEGLARCSRPLVDDQDVTAVPQPGEERLEKGVRDTNGPAPLLAARSQSEARVGPQRCGDERGNTSADAADAEYDGVLRPPRPDVACITAGGEGVSEGIERVVDVSFRSADRELSRQVEAGDLRGRLSRGLRPAFAVLSLASRQIGRRGGPAEPAQRPLSGAMIVTGR